MLVGGVALAQQGLIVEPWRKAPAPAAAPVPPLRAMPDSGLGGAVGAPPPRAVEAPRSSAVAFPNVEGPKWSPPVVQLLVDPWAKARLAAPTQKRRWVPSTSEIVDPWADERPRPEPRVASHRAERAERGDPAEAARLPIF
jgi:hypothetical protein